MSGICNFHGKFRDLIPAGWVYKFHGYQLEVSAHPPESIQLWQMGYHLRLNSCNTWVTQELVDALLREDFPWWEEEPGRYHYAVDRQTDKLVPFSPSLHAPGKVCQAAIANGCTSEVTNMLVENCKKRFEIGGISWNLANTLRQMAARGWIKASREAGPLVEIPAKDLYNCHGGYYYHIDPTDPRDEQ